MEYEACGRYKLYIDGFAILPKERNYPLGICLLHAIFFEIERMSEENIEVDEVVCYVTDWCVARHLRIRGFRRKRKVSSQISVYSIAKDRFPVAGPSFAGYLASSSIR